jgi:polyhydroxybutyrate depolymerase
VGSPSQARDDRAFLHAVLADVRTRWPVDDAHVVASGFSQGASMVWDLACYDAADYSAFLPFSGAFWEPLPKACDAGPVVLRQVHGADDSTMPLAGRALFGPYRQGNVRDGFARWIAEDGCAAEPERRREGELDCAEWPRCAQGRLAFCVHAGGHFFRGDWVLGGLRWATIPK